MSDAATLTRARPAQSATGAQSRLAGRAWGALAACLRSRHFWAIQALVLAIAVGHEALEAVGALRGRPQLYLMPVSLFFIPAIYAALRFGKAGAAVTSLACWAFSLPSIVLFHAPAERVGVNLQLTIVLTVSLLVGASVDRERRAHAEEVAANRRLRELNAMATTSAPPATSASPRRPTRASRRSACSASA